MRPPRKPVAHTLIVCLFVVLLPTGTISARDGAAGASSPARRGTVPPSSYRDALLNTPYPLDNTSSLAITGNAAGGKSFHGNIPYGSTTSFQGRLGSTSLDPFLRYSTLPEELSRGPTVMPFYSPTATVPRLEPASTHPFAPGSPRIAAGVMQTQADQPGSMILAPETPRAFDLAGRNLTSGEPTAGAWLSSSARTSEEMRRIVAGEPNASTADHGPARQTRQVMTSQEYQQQLEQLQHDLDRVKTQASDFERDLTTGRQPFLGDAWMQRSNELPLRPLSPEDMRRIIQPEPEMPPSPTTTNPAAGQDLPLAPGLTQGQTSTAPGELSLVSPGDSLAGPRTGALAPSRPAPYGSSTGPMSSPPDLAARLKRIDAIFAPQTDTTTAPKADESIGTLPAMQRVDNLTRALDAPGQILEHPLQGTAGTASSSVPANRAVAPPSAEVQALVRDAIQPSKAPPTSPEPAPAPPADRPAEHPVDRPATPPAPLDAAAQAKFDAYLKSAESDVQQGQYARAAESFSLASIYNPRDARPQLGRSHALLAVGEYLGSAVCLTKAIELDSHASLADVDLVTAVGGPDRFLQRFGDLQERAKTSDAPGLQLLLAYIYHQMKRPEEARTALQAVKKALPSSPAVAALEKAIATASPTVPDPNSPRP